MPITATFTPALFKLSILGTIDPEGIIVSRNAPGTLLVNAGGVPITGGTATVANTTLIEAIGGDGGDTIALDETNGALPAAELYGVGGNDSLTGGSGNDTLTGGDGEDQMFGDDGNDRMIWNPGDDSDFMEGGNGSDAAVVNGEGGDEVFTVMPNGTRVRFDRVSPAPFVLDIGTTEALVLNAGGGNDSISTSGALSTLISLTLDGGAGDDTILGGNGVDTILGGDGNDFVDGQQGNDVAFLGAGNDVFQWDPGDGSDTIEGQADADTLLFNASAGDEQFVISPNGARVRLTRNVGLIVMDANDVEAFTVNALGGIDTFAIHNLSGTDATAVALNLAGTIGGSTGDGQADTLSVNGTGGADTIGVTGSGTAFTVSGLTASVAVTNSEVASDLLVINALGGDDSIVATTLSAGVVKLTVDGGAGNDTILASQGVDTILAGDGNDFVLGDNGNDTVALGAGDDVFEWAPGDGNDLIEGQADLDELRFTGANASESINIAPNGGRILFSRDVAAVTMDLDDVEKIRFDALGGADNIIVGDLSATDATNIELRLAASGGGGDGAIDTVTVNGSGAGDGMAISSAGGIVSVTGLAWTVSIIDAEGANDRLTLNGQAANDVINASTLAAGLVSLTVNGGLGNDLLYGSAGDDLVNGGDGDDTALLGAGDDVFTWNPGDDNDTIEGQAGTDILRFNGSALAENISISANGGRVTFFRDIANVTMDLDDTELIQFAALGGADTITVNDLSGTDASGIALNLASVAGGVTGDSAIDTLTLNASDTASTITLSGTSGAQLQVNGLPATVVISQFETSGTVDRLTILARGGNDDISATGLVPHFSTLTIDGGAGNDIIRSNGEGTYLGGIGDDLIFAGLTNAFEALDGGPGIDTLDTTSFTGLYTINLVTGATGFSSEAFTNFENLISGLGNDTVTGTDGANVIQTNSGIDSISAAGGNDTLNGGAGADTMAGGSGDDTYYVDNIGDVVNEAAGQGVDVVYAAASYALTVGSQVEILSTVLHAATTAINLLGNAFANVIIGNAGDNGLNGGGGVDVLQGLGGNDTYQIDQAGDGVIEAVGGGSDVVFSAASFVLAAGTEVEVLSTVSHAATTAIDLTGNEFANAMIGNAGSNTLNGGGGIDAMQGLGGNDTYLADQAGDAVIEAAGGGIDSLFSAASFVLAAGTEVELLSTISHAATDAIDLTGNEFANAVVGNAGGNVLNGGGGADVLRGFGGNDTYYVDQAGDSVIEAAGGGSDALYSAASFVLGPDVEVELLSTISHAAIDAINLSGNGFANTLIGNAGGNTLNGGGGVDLLLGLGGDDVYLVDQAGDQVLEAAGGGNDLVYTSASYALAGGTEVETLSTNLYAATDAINLVGNEFANTLIGNDGANLLVGGGGSDFLYGLDGADIFAFNAVPDAGNVDAVFDFVAGTDKLALDDAVFAGLGPGALPASAFIIAGEAGDPNYRVVYNPVSGAMFFDADGTGAAAAVQFATLVAGLNLAASDFMVI